MAQVPLPLRIDPRLLQRVDAARGDVPRTRFVVRALEAALGDTEPRAERVATVARAVRATAPAVTEQPMPPPGFAFPYICMTTLLGDKWPCSTPGSYRPGKCLECHRERVPTPGYTAPSQCPEHPDAGKIKSNGATYCDAPLCRFEYAA